MFEEHLNLTIVVTLLGIFGFIAYSFLKKPNTQDTNTQDIGVNDEDDASN